MSSKTTTAFTSFSSMFSAVLVECPSQVAAYGACLQARGANLTHGACSPEFAALKTCSQASLKKLRTVKR
jgi:hypothetical protein